MMQHSGEHHEARDHEDEQRSVLLGPAVHWNSPGQGEMSEKPEPRDLAWHCGKCSAAGRGGVNRSA
jgi:hypothetical protein